MAKMLIKDSDIVYPIVPEGNHLGRVYSVIDMGTETFNYNGRDIEQRKIRIAWELPNETYTYEDKEGKEVTKCHIVAAKYTASKGKNSKLRPVLKALLGDIPTEEMNIFDIVGKTSMVDVEHGVGKASGKPYAKVNAVTSVPKGMPVPMQINESVEFTFDDFNQEVFDKLPKWIQGDLMKTPEYQHKFGNIVNVDYPTDNIDPDSIPF